MLVEPPQSDTAADRVAARDTLVESESRRGFPLVWIVLRQLVRGSTVPWNAEINDLFQAGVIGLLQAADRYDPGRGTVFSTFAEYRIRGAILDVYRGAAWLSRIAREKVKRLSDVRRALEQRWGRPVEDLEIADELGIDIAAVREISELGDQRMIGLEIDADQKLHDADLRASVEARQYKDLETKRTRRYLEKLLEKLTYPEQRVIRLEFFDGLSNQEIAEKTGVSQGYTANCRAAARAKLRRAAGVPRDAFRGIYWLGPSGLPLWSW